MNRADPPPRLYIGSVLVVGGCGFLGHHIVRQLLERYRDSEHQLRISVLDVRIDRNRIADTAPSVAYYAGDITAAERVQAVMDATRPRVIIHTASPLAATAADSGVRELYERVNVLGTRTLLACAARAGCVRAFVYTSSASVVHDGVSDLVLADERLPVLRPPQQRDAYSASKGAADELVRAANRQHALRDGDAAAGHRAMLTTVLRPAAIFGEGDVQNIPNVLATYDRGLWWLQLGDNRSRFDLTYVGNVAYAHLLAMEKLLETAAREDAGVDDTVTSGAADDADFGGTRVDGQAFFITNGDPYPFWTFARAVWAAAGHAEQLQPDTLRRRVWVVPTPLGLGIAALVEGVFWLVALLAAGLGRRVRQPTLTRSRIRMTALTRTYSIDRARRALGYRPLVSMPEAIERSVHWFVGEKAAARDEPAPTSAAQAPKAR